MDIYTACLTHFDVLQINEGDTEQKLDLSEVTILKGCRFVTFILYCAKVLSRPSFLSHFYFVFCFQLVKLFYFSSGLEQSFVQAF